MFRKFHVKKDERALLFYKGDFERILHPGEHRIFDPLFRRSVQNFALEKPLFDHRLAEYLRQAEPELIAREFHAVETGPSEVGLRYENGVIVEVLAPDTRRLYWKGFVDVRVEKRDIEREFEIEASLVRQLMPWAKGVYAVVVPQHHIAVLYVDGKVEKLLHAGLHGFWSFRREVRAEIVDLRLQVLEVAGQEILTKDKVSLRVNLNAGYRVSDVLLAYAKQAKPVDYLYKELQFGLRAAVGTRTLDELLENKGVIDEVVSAHIRRREETSATRSLLNTAKVMEDNPVALRLKELETLEKVSEKIDKISVFGGLEGVMKDLVKIR